MSFAGVDSLEDVKNRTYNELFVSGGFIVSDEFVLDPDFIGHSELNANNMADAKNILQL